MKTTRRYGSVVAKVMGAANGVLLGYMTIQFREQLTNAQFAGALGFVICILAFVALDTVADYAVRRSDHHADTAGSERNPEQREAHERDARRYKRRAVYAALGIAGVGMLLIFFYKMTGF